MSIEVANGTGMSGQAGQMSQLLAGLGYHTGSTASPGYGHATTEIRYAPDSLTAARQVAAQIPGGATLLAAPVSDANGLQPRGDHRLQLRPGEQLRLLDPAATTASATAGTSPASGASTTLPGTNAATYVLPGAPSGQPVPAC